MSSKQPSGMGFQEELAATFIEEHRLDASLAADLIRLMRASASGLPTVLHAPRTGSSSETLLFRGPSSTVNPKAAAGAPVGHEPLQREGLEEIELPQMDFESLGILGRGGMAEVHRVSDDSLHRLYALKLLDERYLGDSMMRARFLAEAQITAQLAHPSIPPVHLVGEVDSGLPFFTMKEVHGETLARKIQRIYSGKDTDGQWSEARLLGVFQRVCEAVAYAHARGVVHGDLKPSNIMVGDFGEVLVMDWGVARLVRPPGDIRTEEGLVSLGAAARTADHSAVAGTPAYMPPEQAMGLGEELCAASDVYALGVVLFEVLCGFRPYRGSQAQLLVQSSMGKLPEMTSEVRGDVQGGLQDIIRRAMSPAPEDRFAHAGELATEVARWLEGSIRRENALAEVRAARFQVADTYPLRTRATEIRQLALEQLRLLGDGVSMSRKVAAWKLEDEASQLQREADLTTSAIIQRLNNALAHVPDLAEAHALLARLHFEEHRRAEERRDTYEAERIELLLKAHDRGAYTEYLKGTGGLTLETNRPARAKLYRYVLKDRRLQPQLVRELGMTPLVDVELPVGSYLLSLQGEGTVAVSYPFTIGRAVPWVHERPSQLGLDPLYLPEEEELRPGEVYVPGGWMLAGCDDDPSGMVRTWVDGFAMTCDPVNMSDFMAFLASDAPGVSSARRDLFRSRVKLFRGEWPAVGMSWSAARDYAAWHAERSGLDYRLPSEVEWEKAARGVDGRTFPWGERFDESFAHVRTGSSELLTPVAFRKQHIDRSVYGVMGMAGGVRDWCAERYEIVRPTTLIHESMPCYSADGLGVDTSGAHVVRGGSFRLSGGEARTFQRAGFDGSHGYPDVGFRLVRTLPPRPQ